MRRSRHDTLNHQTIHLPLPQKHRNTAVAVLHWQRGFHLYRVHGGHGMTHFYSPIEQIALAKAVGWRGALAQGNGAFRPTGTYDAPADARRERRRLKRMAAKAQRKEAKK